MTRSLPKLLTLVASLMNIAVAGYFVWRAQTAAGQLEAILLPPPPPPSDETETEGSDRPISLVSMDEIFANVASHDKASHNLAMKLEFEIFQESDRPLLDQRQAGIKNIIIQSALQQDMNQLSTIPGKLFFKETLVSRLNTYFNRAVIRDIHFDSFYLQ